MTKTFEDLVAEIEAKAAKRTPAGWLRRRSLAGYNALHSLTHPWVIPGYYWRQAKWFVQRGRRGWADCDTWALDSYLLGWLPDAMTNVRRWAYSHPGDMTFSEWLTLIVKIEDGLRAGAQVRNIEPWRPGETVAEYKARIKPLEDEFAEAWRLLGEHFPSI